MESETEGWTYLHECWNSYLDQANMKYLNADLLWNEYRRRYIILSKYFKYKSKYSRVDKSINHPTLENMLSMLSTVIWQFFIQQIWYAKEISEKSCVWAGVSHGHYAYTAAAYSLRHQSTLIISCNNNNTESKDV